MTEGSGDNVSSDLSSLCQPILLGTEGVTQLIRSVHSGTSEIRHLLLNECDIVYECKLCRSLFRGLPNFIAHKRVYCTELHTSSRLHFVDDKPEDETIVVQATEGGSTHIGVTNAGNTDGPRCADVKQESRPNTREQTRAPDDEATRKATTSQTAQSWYTGASDCNAIPNKGRAAVKPYDFYTRAARRVSKKRLKKRTNVLRLESVASNKNAAFQTNAYDVDVASLFAPFPPTPVDTHDDGATTATSTVTVVPENATGHVHMNLRKRASSTEVPPEVVEQKVNPEMPVSSHVSTEDRAAAHAAAIRTHMSLRQRCSHKTPTAQRLSLYSDCDVAEMKCLKCNVRYSTLKTLNYHMLNAHAEKRRFFPCLFCTRTFSQMWGTTRHIRLVHHKTPSQVQKLRCRLKELSYSKSMEELGQEMMASHNSPSDAPTSTSAHKRCRFSVTPPVRPTAKQPVTQNALVAARSPVTQNAVVAAKSFSRPSQIVFSSGFSLHVCHWCRNVFGKKNLFDSHVATCQAKSATPQGVVVSPSHVTTCQAKSSTPQGVAVSPSKKGRPVSSALLKPPPTSIKEEPTMGSVAPNDDPLMGISDDDLRRICAMVDDTKLVCLKCHRHYGTISNLHRHAVRHLGWRRFKCRLCRYTAYNRSECTSHLHRVHTANVITQTKTEIENLILDLEPEKMKRERPALSRVDLFAIRRTSGLLPNPGEHALSSSYNISTRRHARTFNTRPYGWTKVNSAVLCTRSGVYRKPEFSVARSTEEEEEEGDTGDGEIDSGTDGEDVQRLNECGGEKDMISGDETVKEVSEACVTDVESCIDVVLREDGSNECDSETLERSTKNGDDDTSHVTSFPVSGDCAGDNILCRMKKETRENDSDVITEMTNGISVCENGAQNNEDCPNDRGDHAADNKELKTETSECTVETVD